MSKPKTQNVYLFGEIAKAVANQDKKHPGDWVLQSLMSDFWGGKITTETFYPDLEEFEPNLAGRWVSAANKRKADKLERAQTRRKEQADPLSFKFDAKINHLLRGTSTPDLVRLDPVSMLETFVAFCEPDEFNTGTPISDLARLSIEDYRRKAEIPDLFINTYIKNFRLSARGLKLWRDGKGIKNPVDLINAGEVAASQKVIEVHSIQDIPNPRHRAWVAYAKTHWCAGYTEESMANEIWTENKKDLAGNKIRSLVTESTIRGILSQYRHLR